MNGLYDVRVDGCHDSTYVTVDLTAEQAGTVRDLAAAITAEGGGCHPTMKFDPHLCDEDCPEEHA